MDDTISRQAAIDIERRATVDTNPKHFESHQKFVEFMDDAEISSFGRWQWSNGFNTALTAVGIDLKRLPSAERRGRWTIESIHQYELAYGTTAYEPVYKCSCCGLVTESYLRFDEPIMPDDADFPKWCPSCGARMEESE